MNVELRPHIADNGTEFDQNLVMVDGRQAGWIGNRSDSALVLLPGCHVPKKDLETLRSTVSELQKRNVELKAPPEMPKVADLKKAIDDN